MPTPPLREDHPKMQEALDAWARENNNYDAGARRLNLAPGTFRHRVNVALAEGLTPFVEPQKPRIRVPARSTSQSELPVSGEAVRVFVWGCAHDSPDIPDKSRFRHAGLLASELKPDYIVDLGDSADFDSLSRHPPPGSEDDIQRPRFRADIDSLTEAYAAFAETAPDTPKYHLHGNHEYRAWRYEYLHPSAQGMFTTEVDQVFARFGWSIKNYRDWLFLEGVGFTHVPINAAGKEYGGKTVENTLLNESTFSVVWSHIHKQHFVRRAKVGVGNALQSYNTGTFMPQGLIKPYAQMAMTGWTYGPSELTLRDGQIESARYWSVQELSERYS